MLQQLMRKLFLISKVKNDEIRFAIYICIVTTKNYRQLKPSEGTADTFSRYCEVSRIKITYRM